MRPSQQRPVGFSLGEVRVLVSFRVGGPGLSAGEAIDLIVVAEDGDVRIAAGGY